MCGHGPVGLVSHEDLIFAEGGCLRKNENKGK